MTPSQLRTTTVIAVLIAVSRWPAVAHSIMDWDEAQFVSAVRDYDVLAHHPHPPGYPLFIALAKLFYLMGVDEFRSLQTVVFIGSALLFPAALMMAREMRFDLATSVIGAAMLAFLPNVWVYGGTGFSDVPALSCALFACAFLLRGAGSSRAFLAGGLLLGLAVAFRPLSLLTGMVPFVIGAAGRARAGSFRNIAASGAIVLVVGGGSYVAAALLSGSIAEYLQVVRAQSEWVRNVDSFRSDERPGLGQAARVFLLRPFDQPQQMDVLATLAVISLVVAIAGRRRPPVLAALTFAPVAVVTWLTLDIHTPSRYAIAYLFGYCILAADAIGVLTARSAAQYVVAVVAIASMGLWTWPAIRTHAVQDSPAVAALKWADENAEPDDHIYVTSALMPHAAAVLPHRDLTLFEDGTLVLPDDGARVLLVDWRLRPRGEHFVWPREELWRVIRQRGFDASVVQLGGEAER